MLYRFARNNKKSQFGQTCHSQRKSARESFQWRRYWFRQVEFHQDLKTVPPDSTGFHWIPPSVSEVHVCKVQLPWLRPQHSLLHCLHSPTPKLCVGPMTTDSARIQCLSLIRESYRQRQRTDGIGNVRSRHPLSLTKSHSVNGKAVARANQHI